MKPYLSIVVAARNDNYGGDFLCRMNLFLSALAVLCNRHGLRAELLIVEWNPPADRFPLRDAIDWPQEGNSLAVRIITVPESAHRKLPGSEKIPMLEYIAKNVGVRRAGGDFVLVTNPDIIFSDEAIAYFAQESIPEDCFVKADRYDVGKRVPLGAPVDKTLRHCRRNVVRIWGGDFPSVDPRLSTKVRAFLSRPNPTRLVRWVTRTLKERKQVNYNVPEAQSARLHIGAAGDFILMSRHRWHSLRGFPELPTNSNIDTFMVYVAAAAGLKQIVMSHRIYHQEHDRSEQRSRPITADQEVQAFREMLQTREPISPNGENWGLGSILLPEEKVSTSDGVCEGTLSGQIWSPMAQQ